MKIQKPRDPCRNIWMVVFILLASGCAGTTQTIQQAQNFSSSGIAYSDSVSALLDVSIPRIIDDDSNTAIRTRKRLPADSLSDTLTELDDALKPLVEALASFRSTTDKMKAYFVALQELAGSTAPAEVGPAVGSLVDSINGANQAIKKTEKVKISDAEKGFIQQLGVIAAESAQAGKIRASFKASAEVIGEQLILQQLLLEEITAILKDIHDREMDQLANKIREAYAYKETSIGQSWKDDRKEWITSSFFVESLQSSVNAAMHMQDIWKNILEGGSDPGSINLLLAELNEVVAAVQGLDAARKQEDSSE